MSSQPTPSSPPLSLHTTENPNPPAPKLLRAAVLLTRASARLAEACTSMEQAQRDIEAARSEVPPEALWNHNTLRTELLADLLQGKAAQARCLKLASMADALCARHPGEEGGAA